MARPHPPRSTRIIQPDVVDMPDVLDSYGASSGAGSGQGGSFIGSFFNHPKGLFPLFFTEMWERFSFYLMIALLALYMTDYLGFNSAKASDVTTWYLSLVYFTPFLGGLIADRLTGYIRAIIIGGLLMMAGHIMLAFDTKEAVQHYFLFGALGLIICGNGMFKPNISTMVGNIYAPGDRRRDQGFTIFYMGINIGATIAPLAANYLRRNGPALASQLLGRPIPEEAGWHIAFGSAGIGMLLSLLVFLSFGKRLRESAAESLELAPAFETSSFAVVGDKSGDAWLLFGQYFNMITVTFFLAWLLLGQFISWPPNLREIGLWPTSVVNFGMIWLVVETITVLIFLKGGSIPCANAAKLKSVFVIVALFWMAFHQNSVTLTFFAKEHTQSTWDAETFAAINPAFILLLSPVMVLLWSYLGARGREPSSTSKIILGMFVTGIAYIVMVVAGKQGGDSGRVSPYYLVGCYFFLTVAELWVSPIGLSLTSKLAPVKYKGLWMGFWFLATAVGNKLVHVTGQFWDQYPPSQLFLVLVISSAGAAIVLDYILINLQRFGPPSSEA